MKELLKSVHFCQSYHKKLSGTIFVARFLMAQGVVSSDVIRRFLVDYIDMNDNFNVKLLFMSM